MRSSGLTTVSRTSDRIDSVRRNRRGRRVKSAGFVVTSLFDWLVVVVVIQSFPEKSAGAVFGAKSPAGLLERAVGAIPFAADPAALEVRLLIGIPASDASSFLNFHHGFRPKYS